jgi:hypothetical protein
MHVLYAMWYQAAVSCSQLQLMTDIGADMGKESRHYIGASQGLAQ